MNMESFIKQISLLAMFLLSSLLAPNSWALTACGSGSYANSEAFSNSGVSFSVEWSVCAVDTLEMKMTGDGTGWIGVGFSESSSMPNTDIVIGGVNSDGSTYLVDTWASGRSSPSVDVSQDYTLVSANESASSTTIEFTRSLNTGDSDDYALDGVARYLLWAIGGSDDITYHGGFRGISATAIDFSASPVPLPAGLPLLLTALGLLGVVRRKA